MTEELVVAPPENPGRFYVWRLVTFPWFDRFILLSIAANCFFMAIEDPVGNKNAENPPMYFAITHKQALAADYILLWVFTIEALLKTIAYAPWGYFFGPDRTWNRLDFVVVMLGWLEEFPEYIGSAPFNVSFLRIFRVLRPLRTLSKVDGLKELIGTMFRCYDPLTDVMSLTIFIFFVFSVLGMELFQGQGSQRCLDVSDWDEKKQEGTWTVMPDDATFPIEERRCGGAYMCPSDYEGTNYKCFHAGRNPAQEVYKQNQADGIIGYDNLGQAMLTVFVFCTLEGWVDGMYQFQDSFQWGVSTVFHVSMVLLGTMFCMNLALAVIADTFEGEGDEDEDSGGGDKGGSAATRDQSSESKDSEGGGGGDDDESMDVEVDRKGRDSLILSGEEEGEKAPEKAPLPSPELLRRPFYFLTYSSHFDGFILLLILANTVTLAMESSPVKCLPLVGQDEDGGTGDDGWISGGFTGTKPKCITQATTMSDDLVRFLALSNAVFVYAFAGEAVVKLIGIGPVWYWKDAFNRFDLLIVVVSFVEREFELKGMTALRCFRLARLFKMAKSWGSLRAIIESLFNVLPTLGSLTLMLLLYMFIAAVAGMQLLGNYIEYEERSRFTDFGIAMLTIFQMLTGENWNEVMFSAITTTGGYYIVVYFVLVICIGNFLVLNLFLAIMLSDFNCGEPPDFSTEALWAAVKGPLGVDKCVAAAAGPRDDDDDEDADDSHFDHAKEKSNSRGHNTKRSGSSSGGGVRAEDDDSEGGFFTDAQLENFVEGNGEDPRTPRGRMRSNSLEKKRALEEAGKQGAMEMVSIQKDLEQERKEKALAERNRLVGISLGCLGRENKFRKLCCRICRDPNFESLILFCIIFGSITLACDGPTNDSDSPVWRALGFVDFGFVVLFTIEMALKIVTLGFLFCPEAYLADPWNQLDFVVVLVAWVSADYAFLPMPWSGAGASVGALRTLRSLRALRPLRTIQRLPGMRLVVAVLFECAPVFINICFVVLFFFLVFAIIGVQFFAGRFWSCNDGSVDNVDQCWGCFEDPDGVNPTDKCPDGSSQRQWSNQKMNFDNVWQALLTLYEVAGLEMWLDVMYAGMDTRPNYTRNVHGDKHFPYGAQPQQEANWSAALFFVVFVLVGVFIVLNLFVGAVVDKFDELKAKNGGKSMLQTEEQAQYTESMSLMARMRPFMKPLPPREPRKKALCRGVRKPFYLLRMQCYKVVMWDTSGKDMGTTFDLVISLCVMLNIFVMGLYYWRRVPDDGAFKVNGDEVLDFQATRYYGGLELLNNVFTGIFAVEMGLKLMAWGFRQYWQDMWNQLDFVLVVGSVAGVVVEAVLTSGVIPLNPAVFRIVRVARITRALKSIRMVGRIKGIARLVDTLVLAIPAMANVASLCFLVIFIFTVMGMDFFGQDDIQLEYVNGMYNQHCNFRKFGEGFMLLFRTVTGEAWNGVMHDMMVAKCDPKLNPNADDEDDGDYDEHYCGAPHTQAWLFFLVFNVFVTGLLFELITAIVLDEFGKMNDQDSLPVNQDMIANFNDHWAHLDPKATQMIPQHKLLPFLKSVEPPIFENPSEAAKEVFKMNINATEGKEGYLKVHYVDTLLAVVRYSYIKKLGDAIGDAIDMTMLEAPDLTTRIVSAYPHLKEIEKMDAKDFRSELAATKVQQAFKRRLAHKMFQKKRHTMEMELSRRKSFALGAEFDGMVPDEVKTLPAAELQKQLKDSFDAGSAGGGGGGGGGVGRDLEASVDDEGEMDLDAAGEEKTGAPAEGGSGGK